MTDQPLKAPFPYFGGKSRVAHLIWERFGDVSNYVEPFFGSGAVLLARPQPFRGVETVNDRDGFIANFWRALRDDPEGVTRWADWPVNEADLAARHYWLVTEGADRLSRVLGDPDGYDAKVAGWWVWGASAWIGSGWCSGAGPWAWDGEAWTKGDGQGVNRKLPHLGDAGQGVNRQLPHLGDAGRGINRKLPHLGNAGRGVNRQTATLTDYMQALSARLRCVRVAHGDWSRVMGKTVTQLYAVNAVFLDPPYSNDLRAALYTHDCGSVAAEARAWAIENGGNTKLRICLAGYDGEHAMPDGWTAVRWKANGGYGSQGQGRGRENAARETLWFSPHCLASAQQELGGAA